MGTDISNPIVAEILVIIKFDSLTPIVSNILVNFNLVICYGIIIIIYVHCT